MGLGLNEAQSQLCTNIGKLFPMNPTDIVSSKNAVNHFRLKVIF